MDDDADLNNRNISIQNIQQAINDHLADPRERAENNYGRYQTTLSDGRGHSVSGGDSTSMTSETGPSNLGVQKMTGRALDAQVPPGLSCQTHNQYSVQPQHSPRQMCLSPSQPRAGGRNCADLVARLESLQLQDTTNLGATHNQPETVDTNRLSHCATRSSGGSGEAPVNTSDSNGSPSVRSTQSVDPKFLEMCYNANADDISIFGGNWSNSWAEEDPCHGCSGIFTSPSTSTSSSQTSGDRLRQRCDKEWLCSEDSDDGESSDVETNAKLFHPPYCYG
eukprot:Selendium_serpulae@DN1485_c0_g1_i1.p1